MSTLAGRPDTPASLDVIWGAKRIAIFLRCGTDTVYSISSDPAGPVKKRCGRLFAFAGDLETYLRDAPAAANDA